MTTTLTPRPTPDTLSWRPVCPLDRLPVERAVAALVDRRQLALVRTHDDTVHVVGHRDPRSGANVMARGIVGTTVIDGEVVPTLISPLYKEIYDLRTGICVSDPRYALGRWPARIADGTIEVGLAPSEVTTPAVTAREA